MLCFKYSLPRVIPSYVIIYLIVVALVEEASVIQLYLNLSSEDHNDCHSQFVSYPADCILSIDSIFLANWGYASPYIVNVVDIKLQY